MDDSFSPRYQNSELRRSRQVSTLRYLFVPGVRRFFYNS